MVGLEMVAGKDACEGKSPFSISLQRGSVRAIDGGWHLCRQGNAAAPWLRGCSKVAARWHPVPQAHVAHDRESGGPTFERCGGWKQRSRASADVSRHRQGPRKATKRDVTGDGRLPTSAIPGLARLVSHDVGAAVYKQGVSPPRPLTPFMKGDGPFAASRPHAWPPNVSRETCSVPGSPGPPRAAQGSPGQWWGPREQPRLQARPSKPATIWLR